jgi:hypothetical protein
MSLTAANQGYYRVNVNGIDVSQHTQVHTAAWRALTEKLKDRSAAVYYWHDYKVYCDLDDIKQFLDQSPPPPPAPMFEADVTASLRYRVIKT